jgi:hypothetical protein
MRAIAFGRVHRSQHALLAFGELEHVARAGDRKHDAIPFDRARRARNAQARCVDVTAGADRVLHDELDVRVEARDAVGGAEVHALAGREVFAPQRSAIFDRRVAIPPAEQ